MFYFRPGHETFPSFHDDNVIKVISNAIRWLKPAYRAPYPKMRIPDSLETISEKDFKPIEAGILND